MNFDIIDENPYYQSKDEISDDYYRVSNDQFDKVLSKYNGKYTSITKAIGQFHSLSLKKTIYTLIDEYKIIAFIDLHGSVNRYYYILKEVYHEVFKDEEI